MLKEKQIYGSCFGKVCRVKSNSFFLGQSDLNATPVLMNILKFKI